MPYDDDDIINIIIINNKCFVVFECVSTGTVVILFIFFLLCAMFIYSMGMKLQASTIE